jgi:hypothetical protein
VVAVLQAQGKMAEAQAAFWDCLQIIRRLAEHDPSNAGWQRGLAVACARIASLESKAGEHASALPLYEKASRIFGELAQKAPGFTEWATDKENIESELARCTLETAKLPGANPASGSSASTSLETPNSSA